MTTSNDYENGNDEMGNGEPWDNRWIGDASDFVKTKNADGTVPEGANEVLARIAALKED